MNDRRNIATYLLSISLFCLAGALVYFTIELTRIANQIPTILASIEQTSERIGPVITEVNKIRELIPPIVNEISEIRKQIPNILEEVKQTRALVPTVLEEVKQARILIPSILEEVKQARVLVPSILDEVKQTRESIPSILNEVKETREAIPPMMARADRIVTDAREVGKKASEGAVTGVIAGIIKAPFNIVGGLGKSMFGSLNLEAEGLNDKDRELSVNAANEILSAGKVGESRTWSNPDSGNKGTVTLKDTKIIHKRECRVMHIVVRVAGEEPINKDITACLNDESVWEALE